MVDYCYMDTIHHHLVSCRPSNNVMEASVVGILSSTVGEQWEWGVEHGVYVSVCVERGWFEGLLL